MSFRRLLNHVRILKLMHILPVIGPKLGGIKTILLILNHANTALGIFIVTNWEEWLVGVDVSTFSHWDCKI